MKVSDKGITVDIDVMRRAFISRELNFHTVFSAITVDKQDSPRHEVIAIDTNGSSALAYALYEPATQRLVVKFASGGMYRYENVDLQLAFDLATAPSKGEFFHNKIRAGRVATRMGR